MKKNLVLVGMMGSGKSTIGKLISRESGLEFIDTDELIEIHEKMEIKEIFKNKGEDFFRRIEEKIILKVMKQNGYVIAVGGGAFINSKVRKEINKNGISFWLNWKEDVLIKRIKYNKKRPKVTGLTLQELRKLIISRSKIYIKADFKINCDKLDKFQITKTILEFYEK
tara:strand:- start:77 stop:580 length:504 start_codon:yes stop_codon:yes gene_type:complete